LSREAPSVEKTEQEQHIPFYRVLPLDDSEHTCDYVIEMLEELFCMSASDADRRAVEVDTTGGAVVITCELPALSSRATRSTPMARTGAWRSRKGPCRR
jgi:ATP-dependent Clp protease adapter protein ClpS